jgi:hypothetical protein
LTPGIGGEERTTQWLRRGSFFGIANAWAGFPIKSEGW